MTLTFSRAVATGGRKFTDYERIEADLQALRRHGLRRVAEGASHGGGADELRLAVAAGERLHGLAYPDAGSRGTWHCTAEMLRRGIPVVVWAPDDGQTPRHQMAWRRISAGLAMYGLPDPLVFEWGTPRGVVAPVGLADTEEHAFASFALQVREALGEM